MFQQSWFTQWPFLHYDESNDLAYCHTCVMGFKQKKMRAAKADPAFVSALLCNYCSWSGVLVASFPGPAQLSVAISTVKRERAWYLFSREWRQDRKDGRKGLIVRGCTGPRTAKRANVAGNLPHVSSYRRAIVVYTERWVCSQLRNTRNAACFFWNFLPFSDYIMLTWEKIPGSPRFSVLQATKSWAGPGNEARVLGV